MTQPHDWNAFYEATQGHQPFPTLLKAMAFFAAEKRPAVEYFAVDLGCGAGRDTFTLLAQGWRVLALDKQPEAIERVLHGVAPAHRARLEVQVATFEEIVLPAADLISASFSLPFCRPQYFQRLWSQIVTALPPGGRFAGQFFGIGDSWASRDHMTFHTQTQIEQLLQGFELEYFKEIDEDGKTATGASKHWHVFHIVAQKLKTG